MLFLVLAPSARHLQLHAVTGAPFCIHSVRFRFNSLHLVRTAAPNRVRSASCVHPNLRHVRGRRALQAQRDAALPPPPPLLDDGCSVAPQRWHRTGTEPRARARARARAAPRAPATPTSSRRVGSRCLPKSQDTWPRSPSQTPERRLLVFGVKWKVLLPCNSTHHFQCLQVPLGQNRVPPPSTCHQPQGLQHAVLECAPTHSHDVAHAIAGQLAAIVTDDGFDASLCVGQVCTSVDIVLRAVSHKPSAAPNFHVRWPCLPVPSAAHRL